MPISKHRTKNPAHKPSTSMTPRRARKNLKNGSVLSIDRALAAALTEARKNMQKPVLLADGTMSNPNGTIGQSNAMKLAKENFYDG